MMMRILAAVVVLIVARSLAAQTEAVGANRFEFTVRTGDGLRIGLGARGELLGVASGSRPLVLRDEPGGLFVTDVAALLVPRSGESNRAPDHSFEIDGDGDLFPDGWSFSDFWGSGGQATWDPSVAHEGHYSIRIDGSGGEAILSDLLDVLGGERLIIQAYCQGDSRPRTLAFWFDAGGRRCGATLGRWFEATASFAPFGEIIVAPREAARVCIGFQLSGGPTSYLDSARLVTPDRAVHTRLDGPFEAGPAGGRQVTDDPIFGLRTTVTWQARSDGIIGRVDLCDRCAADRALDLTLVLPLHGDARVFHGTPRRDQGVERWNRWGEFQRYAETDSWGIPFGGGEISLYPLAALSEPGTGAGVALGIPPGDAAPFVLAFDTRPGAGLTLRWPVGISSQTRSGSLGRAGEAERIFVLARADEPWGFRRALRAEAKLFPRYGERRFGTGGLWLPFTSPASIPDVGDFRFAVHEGDGSVADDDGLGILSFVYIEPWDFWLDLGDYDRQPTYDEAIARLTEVASGSGGWPSFWVDMARATLVGGHRGADGRLLHRIGQAPWISGSGWSFLVSHNPEPALRDPSVRGWASPYDVQLGRVLDAYRRASDSGAVLDGTYLDSMTTYFSGDLDRRVRQWRGIDSPLTYDARSFEPALWPPAQVVAVARAHADRERAAGRWTMGNSIARWSRPAAVHLDFMGIEANWGQGPESDADLLARRAAAYRKPYCILQNTDFDAFDHAEMEGYMARCLFYGIFASCFSQDAATNPYWEDPSLYERDRDLFIHYVPLVQELDGAGWEPVTEASSDNAAVIVERFGGQPPALFFTELNDAPQAASHTLTINKGPLGLGSIVSVTDRITGESLTFSQDADSVRVSDHLQAGQTRMLQVD